MKRLFYLLIAFVFLLGMLPSTAAARPPEPGRLAQPKMPGLEAGKALPVPMLKGPAAGPNVLLVVSDDDADVDGGDPLWSRVSEGRSPVIASHGGTSMAWFDSFDYTGSQRLETGALNLSGTAAPQLVFWMSHDPANPTFVDRIQIQVSTDGTSWADVGAAIPRYDADCVPVAPATGCWQQHTLALTGYKANPVYIGFLGISQYGWNIYLDDVSVSDGANPPILQEGFETAVPPSGWTQTSVPWVGGPLEQMLRAYGDLGTIGRFDAHNNTPVLGDLTPYDVVLTWSDYDYFDPTALGDVLADYVDAGGKVINLDDSMIALADNRRLAGRFITGNYVAMWGATSTIVAPCLGTFDSAHPIMQGISAACNHMSIPSGLTLTPGASAVAHWDDANTTLFVAAKDNRTVVSINAYLGLWSIWTGQMNDLVHNAILWLIKPPTPNVLLLVADDDTYVGPASSWSQVSEPWAPIIASHGGTYVALFDSYSQTGSKRLETGALDLSGTSAPQLVFWMSHDPNYSTFTDRIQIQVSTDGTSWADVGAAIPRYDAACAPVAPATGCWREHTLALTGYNVNPVHIGFLGISQYGMNIDLDDVTISVGTTTILQEGFESAFPPSGWTQTSAPWVGGPLEQMLRAYGDLGIIGRFDAHNNTPVLADLTPYDVVLTWSGNLFYLDPYSLGDVLADYVDAGGKVINLNDSMANSYGYNLAGRFVDQNYVAMWGTTAANYIYHCLGTIDAPGHPIMQGISAVCTDELLYKGLSLTPGSSAVARWDDVNTSLFVAVKDNRTVVSINAYVGLWYKWTGQMNDLVHNAILWLTARNQTRRISLETGWNLVSFNLHLDDTSIASVLSSISGQYSLVYAWDAATSGWRIYDPTLGDLNDLKNLDEKKGFWIKMNSGQPLVVSGIAPRNTSIDLKNGWNLVGYPSVLNGTLPGVLGDHGVGADFSLVYAYHAKDGITAWKLFDLAGNPLLNDLTALAPGWGYWIKSGGGHTWIVP